MTTPEAWLALKGNECAKRAIEVALAGKHSMTFIGHPQNGKSLIPFILGDKIKWNWLMPCRCGNYGDAYSECLCSVARINRWRSWRMFRESLDSDIIIEIVTPRANDYAHEGEEWGHLEKRIAQKTSVPNLDIDEDGQDLLNLAIKDLGLKMQRVDAVKRVAKTIAELDLSRNIKCHHIAEAVQYGKVSF